MFLDNLQVSNMQYNSYPNNQLPPNAAYYQPPSLANIMNASNNGNQQQYNYPNQYRQWH